MAHGYDGGLGHIQTRAMHQNVAPDVLLMHHTSPGFAVLAEVGQSQSIDDLNDRADLLLSISPGTVAIVLIKVFDTTRRTWSHGCMVCNAQCWFAYVDTSSRIREWVPTERHAPPG